MPSCAGLVLRALHFDSLIPETIDARVDDGWVTLTGTAEWQYQRQRNAKTAAARHLPPAAPPRAQA